MNWCSLWEKYILRKVDLLMSTYRIVQADLDRQVHQPAAGAALPQRHLAEMGLPRLVCHDMSHTGVTPGWMCAFVL